MKKQIKNPLTYVSLFSSAGVGCFGFKQEEFKCVATVEIIKRRLDVQKYNDKCFYESGYIADDIVKEETKERIKMELERWKKEQGMKELDVLISTPPCQGMSVANHKKKNELGRNSLVVESIKLVDDIAPKFFIFENVRAFLNSTCTDVDGKDKKIRQAIELNLGGKYNIHYQVINFKDYGNPSSRTRTLVLGVRKDLQEVTPLNFIPTLQKERTLREVIGEFQVLEKMGQIDETDIYHNFRPYTEHMLPWIEKTKEGESAFDNEDPKRRPHRVEDGKIIFNVRKNGDKYARCYWDKPGPCIHTRNDILASQATVHPSDNRVFSIRELMKLMSIPDSFRWVGTPEYELNKMSLKEKKKFLKKEEMNIRQSIGEAVPTVIFREIAKNIKNSVQSEVLDEKLAEKVICEYELNSHEKIVDFLHKNFDCYSFAELSKIVEHANAYRMEHAAYYTRQDICFTLVKDLPDASDYNSIKILEPSVGVGNFLPLLIEKYKTVPKVEIDLLDIDKNAIEILQILIKKLHVPKNIKINYVVNDFLLYGRSNLFAEEITHYDIVVGNPPYGKVSGDDNLLKEYKKGKVNTKTNNLFSFFFEKALSCADVVALIIPKSFLSAPEFDDTRKLVSNYAISKITDYGEKGFKGVKIETISVIVNTKKKGKDNEVLVESYIKNKIGYKDQNYICAIEYPYWLVYRDGFFDKVAAKLQFDVFSTYRDRQITKKVTKSEGKVRVLKSRNIGNNEIVNIPSYDTFIDNHEQFFVSKYMNNDKVVLIPNLTYNPRACFMPENTIVDGSVAVLLPKEKIKITESDLAYYNSDEFVKFYRVARNYGTRSLNIDNNSVYFFGLQLQ
ncbi:MAG: DNA (cytosine-5-)-methyltransferase, partial [Candidatus Uhrbacteria bacterium]|nr:DNA (cytosine-5-)-methyltransferase [Candidatus Uhrbacteria bacterium]